MKRKVALVNDGIHHIFTRSIAGFVIFNNDIEYLRMRNTALYYQQIAVPCKISEFLRRAGIREKGFQTGSGELCRGEKMVQVIAYCLMPTHVHFLLKQTVEGGISCFMGNVLNSYSRYFNTKHNRRGPLWEGKFKNVLVESDEQLLHLTRYIHLNPVSVSLCDKPEEWKYSSYGEYITERPVELSVANWSDVLSIRPEAYRQFIEERIDHQRELQRIKHLLLE